MDPDTTRRLHDAIAQLESDEQRARRRTVLYSLVPAGLAVLLVGYTGQRVSSAARELDGLQARTVELQEELLTLRTTADSLREELTVAQAHLQEATNLQRYRHSIDYIDFKGMFSQNPAASAVLERVMEAREQGVGWKLHGVTPEDGFDSPSFAAWVLEQLRVLPRRGDESLLAASRALPDRLAPTASPRPGDLAIYPAGYMLFWFRDVNGSPFVIGMTPFGVTSLKPDFSPVQGYRRVEY